MSTCFLPTSAFGIVEAPLKNTLCFSYTKRFFSPRSSTFLGQLWFSISWCFCYFEGGWGWGFCNFLCWVRHTFAPETERAASYTPSNLFFPTHLWFGVTGVRGLAVAPWCQGYRHSLVILPPLEVCFLPVVQNDTIATPILLERGKGEWRAGAAPWAQTPDGQNMAILLSKRKYRSCSWLLRTHGSIIIENMRKGIRDN